MTVVLKYFKAAIKNRPFLRSRYLHAAFLWQARRAASAWNGLPVSGASKPQREIFIFSRFGTETVGNYFIQLGLLRALFEVCSDRRVYLLSASPEVTKTGISGIQDLLQRTPEAAPLSRFIAEKVFVAGEDKIRSLGQGDLLILGGGPIMDDPELTKWLHWFRWARRARARIMIAGCGLGPLRHPRAVTLAESLLGLADATVVRNQPQENFRQAAGCRLQVALDPAFLCLPFLEHLAGPKRRLLAVNARRIGFESAPDRNVTEDKAVELVFHHALRLSQWTQLDEVMPFSTSELGGCPDSILAGRVARLIGDKMGIRCKDLPKTTVTGIVDALASAEYVLSTRMHGFIIALMLGCRAANLDYTSGGGKGADLYRDWLGPTTAPSLFAPDSLHREDFLLLSELKGARAAIDTLLNTYTSAIREALTK